VDALITGMLKRIYRLTSDAADKKSSVVDLFHRLQARGHQASDILPMFKSALLSANKPPPAITTGILFATAPPVICHLPFHPKDVSSRVIQAAFRSTPLLHPKGEPPLPGLRNPEGGFFRFERMIIAYR
jgi:hypothetical protein